MRESVFIGAESGGLGSSRELSGVERVWESIGSGIDTSIDATKRVATGAWEGLLWGASRATDVVKSGYEGVTGFGGDFLSRIQSSLLIGLALLLITVWVVARSGIIGQVAGFVK